ncbi:MAG: hypothetical protein QNJ31_01390 [Candidatus Caenarcaniphilales bacterium]|nr:hypothetical protein [Candidatus Caenarcaniphilales bacterium]
MKHFKKYAAAGFKVLKREIDDYLEPFFEEFGIDKECNSCESIEDEIETKRKKTIDKVNNFFDSLKEEVSQDKTGESKKHNDETLKDIALTIKELKHQIEKVQSDVNEIKAK